MTYRDLLRNALLELNVVDAVQTADAADSAFALNKIKRIFDGWNADPQAAFVSIVSTFTLVPSLNPHTIGPGGTWSVPLRPDDIEDAALAIGGGFLQPINIRTQAWYQSLSAPDLSTAYPTDVFYQTQWPLGALFFYPVPAGPKQIQLQYRQPFAVVTEDTDFSLPFGYEDALTLTLAESVASAFGTTPSPTLVVAAREARNRIFGKHQTAPSLRTQDAGMPSSGSSSAMTFNYLTRQNG